MNGNSEVPTTNDQPQNGIKNHPEEYHYGDTAKHGAAYSVLEQYHSKPTKLRVACVGAGASGLCLAYKMERQLVPGSWELTLFEKNPQFGGTWYENTYPGVACDVRRSHPVRYPQLTWLDPLTLIHLLMGPQPQLVSILCRWSRDPTVFRELCRAIWIKEVHEAQHQGG